MNTKLAPILLLALLTEATCLATDPLDQWEWRNPLPNGNTFNAVTYADGKFVAVGYGGAVAVSTNALTWAERAIPPAGSPDTAYDLYGIANGGGRFVAVGNAGATGAILTSADGLNWTLQSCPGGVYALYAVTYGGGLFLAAGNAQAGGGVLLASPDGTNWVDRTPSESQVFWWGSVAYGGGTYVALAPTKIFASSDPAVGWEEASLPSVSPNLEGVAYGGSRFVTVGTFSLVSPDGLTWSNGLPTSQWFDLSAIAYGGGEFLGLQDATVAMSRDGLRWARFATGLPVSFHAAAYGGGTWVVMANAGMVVSTNLATSGSPALARFEALGSNVTTAGLSGIAYGGGRFVAADDRGNTFISGDGVQWTGGGSTGIGTNGVTMAYGADTFVAADDSGRISVSADGARWRRAASLVPSVASVDLAYGGGRFVLVSAGASAGEATVATSTDGADWTTAGSGYWGNLYSVAYGAGRFVAGGDEGTVLASTDATNWTSLQTAATNPVLGLAYGNGQFVGVGGGFILTSPDGLTWASITNAPASHLVRVRFGGGVFAVLGQRGTILTSTNGLAWVTRDPGTMNYLWDIAYGRATFVAVGETGTILQSGQLPITGLRLGPLVAGSGGVTSFGAAGPPNETWTIQASDNLLDWSFLTERPGTNGVAEVVDPGATNYNRRFYRGFAW